MKSKFLKGLVLVAVFALAATMMAGCATDQKTEASSSSSSSAAAADDNSAEITDLIVGFDDSYPPYGFIGEDGEYTGLDLDLAQEVCDRNGWTLEAKPIDWNSKDVELNSGNINCIWNGFTMEGREDDYTFSEPYMLNEQVIVVKAGSDIKTKDDLAGKVVITQLGSTADNLLKDEEGEKELADTFERLDTVADYNNAFMSLEAGNVDAVICDLSVADYQMADNKDAYTKLDDLLTNEHYAVGFKKGDQALADKVTETLLEMYNDGTVATICEKYAEYGVSVDNWVLTK